jgi:RNA polymerase sigma-70 factor (ECF subfamily)
VRTPEDDLECVYRSWRQQLFTCALGITGCQARAEDAIHQAFYQMYRRIGQPKDLKAYVFRAVRNAALDQLRRHQSAIEPLPEYIFDPGVGPDESAEMRERRQHVVAGLLSLTRDERETIVQHVYGGLTFQEISDVREIALGTVVSWYRRGLQKMREKLEKVDGPA